ncbi:MAG: hypothetical protein LUQ17_00510, partial [Methanomicrobiales archaeon]|nr:hypothetical protein [Methanomicrobiales archaeon]
SVASNTTWYSPSSLPYTYQDIVHTNFTGNHWDIYSGGDGNNDGIGDSPMTVISSQQDLYPLTDNETAYCTIDCPDVTPPDGIGSVVNITWLSESITWEWDDPPDPDLSHVSVYLNDTFVENISAGVRAFTASGLHPGTLYTFQSFTVDTSSNRNLSWVNHSSRTAPDITPPSTVTNLTALLPLVDSIIWTWDDPFDGDLHHLDVYLNGTFIDSILPGVGTIETGHLVPSTSYTLSILTIDADGNQNMTWTNLTASTAPVPETTVTVTTTPTPTGTTPFPTTSLPQSNPRRGNSRFIPPPEPTVPEMPADTLPEVKVTDNMSIGPTSHNTENVPVLPSSAGRASPPGIPYPVAGLLVAAGIAGYVLYRKRI